MQGKQHGKTNGGNKQKNRRQNLHKPFHSLPSPVQPLKFELRPAFFQFQKGVELFFIF